MGLVKKENKKKKKKILLELGKATEDIALKLEIDLFYFDFANFNSVFPVLIIISVIIALIYSFLFYIP